MSWVLLPFFITILILFLNSILPEESSQNMAFNSKLLIFIINLIFVFLSAFVIACLAGWSYLKTGSLSLLLLGTGALMIGFTNALSSLLVGPGRVNSAVAVHNTGVLLAGALHFAATVFASTEFRIGEKFRRLHLTVFYGCVIFLPILLFLYSEKVLSPFFIEGIGFTPLRQMVLGSAVLLFYISGIYLIGVYYGRAETVFTGLYAIALLLFATGLLGVFLSRVMGDPIGWIGRSAQCLGGVFFFIAVLQAYRTSNLEKGQLDELLSKTFIQARDLYKSLIETTSDAVIVIDGERKVLLLNSAAQKMFGYTMNEAVGRSIYAFGISSQEFDSLASKTSSSEATKQVEFTIKGRTGDGFHAEASVSPTRISGRDGHTLIIRDITHRKRAEEALQKNEERLRVAVEGARLGLWYRDFIPDHVTWNSILYQMLGRDPEGEPITGDTFFEYIHPDDRDRVLDHTEESLRKGDSFYDEFRVVCENGDIRWLASSGMVFRDTQGKPMRMAGINHDITARKRIEEELRNSVSIYRTIARNYPGGAVYLFDKELRFLVADGAGLKNIGWSQEALEGRSVGDLDEETRKIVEPRYRRVLSGETFNLETTYRGRSIKSDFVPVRNDDGEVIMGLVVSRDITTQKKMEEALQKSHDELELRVKERTAELEWRNRELEHFTAGASHDLQEPLRKIAIFGELLKKELSGQLSEPAWGHLDRISDATERMRMLIKSLLQYSRVTTQERPFERANLKQIAEDVLNENLYGLLEERQAQIEISDLPEIDADPIQISVLLQNLMANAIRYSKDGEIPMVKVKSEETIHIENDNQRWIKIKIEDNGIGFDMRYLEKIFEPFERLSAAGKFDGSGMGLTICRKIAERHGGTITAESRSGEGSIFIVELPMRQTNE